MEACRRIVVRTDLSQVDTCADDVSQNQQLAKILR